MFYRNLQKKLIEFFLTFYEAENHTEVVNQYLILASRCRFLNKSYLKKLKQCPLLNG